MCLRNDSGAFEREVCKLDKIEAAVRAERERIARLLEDTYTCPEGDCLKMDCIKHWMRYLDPAEEGGRSVGSPAEVSE